MFLAFVIYPLSLSAQSEEFQDFDSLPISESEITSVTNLFWNAKSIQDNVKKSIPSEYHARFNPNGTNNCQVQSVTKTEGSADTCDLNDDPARNAKFIYKLSLSCGFGNYRVSVCSRETSKLLNQLKVESPEKVVSDDNVFDLESTM